MVYIIPCITWVTQKYILSHKATNIVLFWAVDNWKGKFFLNLHCKILFLANGRNCFPFSCKIATAVEILLVRSLELCSISSIKDNWDSFNPLRQSRKQAVFLRKGEDRIDITPQEEKKYKKIKTSSFPSMRH